ncbi:Protein of unknown function [Pyronema omphalodes CBS 100304]|uniref:Uncharacterized protein n=1 Tax=Pyronema omphalodes (strain CBS 100304) TaxID=1076935 RepID=U4L5P3_PYROM|nr:Protein of unknown function [Pyronema omphalodes CBS 100304]
MHLRSSPLRWPRNIDDIDSDMESKTESLTKENQYVICSNSQLSCFRRRSAMLDSILLQLWFGSFKASRSRDCRGTFLAAG